MNDQYLKFNEDKKKSERFIIIGGLVIVVAVIILLLGQGQTNDTLMFLGFAIGFVGFIVLATGFFKFSKLKSIFKDEILTNMFKEAIPDIVYNPKSGLSQSIVYSTNFLKRADRYHSEDYLSGQVEGVDFVSSDVKLEERHVQHTKNGTRVYYVAYFIGRVFRFEFNKEFVGSLFVLESGRPFTKGHSKVELESIDFNKKFKTFATEEITAFYILTPDIIEAISHLEKRHPGRIGLSFQGDHLYVAINNNKDTFELQLFRRIDEAMVNEFKKDLLVIKDFILALKLNNNLFKK